MTQREIFDRLMEERASVVAYELEHELGHVVDTLWDSGVTRADGSDFGLGPASVVAARWVARVGNGYEDSDRKLGSQALSALDFLYNNETLAQEGLTWFLAELAHTIWLRQERGIEFGDLDRAIGKLADQLVPEGLNGTAWKTAAGNLARHLLEKERNDDSKLVSPREAGFVTQND